ncbi:hypothetical protein BD779DRAFT_1622555 [Infundibulicybe gibba]|nr:hypothetical protein BD779DRAFT_1622555 [Infundibulicybe gibba]
MVSSTTIRKGAAIKEEPKVFDPLYSASIGDDGDESYKYSHLKPHYPNVHWDPLPEVPVIERGLSADPSKANLFSAATSVKDLTPAIGTEILGVDLRHLSSPQRDELALLIAERGVVFFRDQELNIEEQLELGRYFGPLHKHPSLPTTRAGHEEVNVVYNDSSRRPDPGAFARIDIWHADVTYELQPPGATSLKVITCPENGGDTIWASGYALYSSLSPSMQTYLEGLKAMRTSGEQAKGARAAGLPVRREEIDTVHPIVRVHPATGWKSIFVDPGFTRRIVGVPKAESDAILKFLFQQTLHNIDHQVRFKWKTNSMAFWDNRVVMHSATFDFWPSVRHALRVTPHAEIPMSVADYEAKTGKKAKDWQEEFWKREGLAAVNNGNEASKPHRFND